MKGINIIEAFEKKIQEAGLPNSSLLIGKLILCKTPSGHLKTTILSVANANDDGFVELAVAPVYYHGDLVTHIVFISATDRRLRTTCIRGGNQVTELNPCNVSML